MQQVNLKKCEVCTIEIQAIKYSYHVNREITKTDCT